MAYLRAKGAKQVGNFLDRAGIWALGKEEFLVPAAAEFADYAYRIADILAALERVEERSQLGILDDLQEVGFDVVRIGGFPEDGTSEAPGIMRAVDFLAHARDLLMAAACAAATRMACSPARRSQDAERFMQSVRLGKMEGYGFAVRILAPVTPVRKSTDSTAEPYALYERSVVPILQESLETLCLAEQKAREGGSAELFEKSAAREDLAKLCAALTGIRKALDSKCLEIGITYSATRSQHLPCARICVEERYFPVIEAVSNAIRENDLEAGRL
ncbi:hypothetical protein B5F76_11770 [Desulfovibrio sp. An276]|uniref:hypothetical protein n=1 Tax=Desulfovibrio sp. An276 TaxID=1965618 RepID=UPI000B398235|nr:hypothetical protein [Desulfovibrio sp. An276]OUO50417.1 hypothetical protein B5F76_11770 [Desulfovibrio sp. An276]